MLNLEARADTGAGIIIGSWVSKHFGRRMCVFVMSCWALVAVTIVITSKSRDQILAGRVLNCKVSQDVDARVGLTIRQTSIRVWSLQLCRSTKAR